MGTTACHAPHGRTVNGAERTTREIREDAVRATTYPPVRPTIVSAWVQRCGIGSTCDCAPEDKLAGIQRDLHPSSGLANPSPTAAPSTGMPAHGTDRLLAHKLAHFVQPAARTQEMPTIGPADDEYERQAHAVAASVTRGRSHHGGGNHRP